MSVLELKAAMYSAFSNSSCLYDLEDTADLCALMIEEVNEILRANNLGSVLVKIQNAYDNPSIDKLLALLKTNHVFVRYPTPLGEGHYC